MRNVVDINKNNIIPFNDDIGSVFHRYICYNAIINSVLTINASLLFSIEIFLAAKKKCTTTPI